MKETGRRSVIGCKIDAPRVFYKQKEFKTIIHMAE
jgi:hypothetical protein